MNFQVEGHSPATSSTDFFVELTAFCKGFVLIQCILLVESNSVIYIVIVIATPSLRNSES